MKALYTLAIMLLISIIINFKFFPNPSDRLWHLNFQNANMRHTYDTVHNIRSAQKIATGKGVKVGILGKYFGYDEHTSLYAGKADFTGDSDAMNVIAEHGYWMASTLREIAPDVEIYALNARSSDKVKQANAFVKAIDWAIENDLDILTYSDQGFSGENKTKIDASVEKAIQNNIVISFIHYPHPDNLFPNMLTIYEKGTYERQPDISIFHYDYNVLFIDRYKRFKEAKGKVSGGGNIPYFSISSTSIVTAGIVSMLKELDNRMTPADYKRILVETSREFSYNGHAIPRVADARAAVEFIAVK